LKEHPELAREIENKVRVALGVPELGGGKAPEPAAKKSSSKESKQESKEEGKVLE
jgi:recombination protein RecA